jgi:GT2 family glycosyltransferase
MSCKSATGIPARASVIVLAWPPNRERDRNVFSLLDSICSFNAIDGLEVVVVCNGDDPDLIQKLETHARVDRVVTPGVNLGVAAGWNAGAVAATGQLLVFANEDLTFGRDSVSALLKPFEDPTVGLAGVEGSTWNRVTMREISRNWIEGKERKPGEIRVVSGYLFAVPSRVWRQVGGIDPALSPASFEEIDLALRIQGADYRLALAPDVNVSHPWGISAGSPRRKITWAGGTMTVRAIARRNHRQVLDSWSPARWRSRRPVHYAIHCWYRLLDSANYYRKGVRERLGL